MIAAAQEFADGIGNVFGHHVNRIALAEQIPAGTGGDAEPTATVGQHVAQGFHHSFNQRSAFGGGKALARTGFQVARCGGHVGVADDFAKRAVFGVPAQILPQCHNQLRITVAHPAAHMGRDDALEKYPGDFGMRGIGCLFVGKGKAVIMPAAVRHIAGIRQPRVARILIGTVEQFHFEPSQGFADVVQQGSHHDAETPNRTEPGNVFGFGIRRPAVRGGSGQRQGGHIQSMPHQTAVTRMMVRFGCRQALHEYDILVQPRQGVFTPVFIG